MTSKELVLNTLEFTNKDGRAPQQLWCLPWAAQQYPEQLKKIETDFPSDFTGPPLSLTGPAPKVVGDAYAVGEYVDEWGCVFTNIHAGIIGEVKHPIVDAQDEEWNDISRIHIPTELLAVDKQAVNDFCRANQDKFIAGPACPRPFEQLQFIRGTEQLYIDLITQPENMMNFIGKMHSFYCELLEIWCQTDVDAISFMDDWGAQNSLLISPALWAEIFKPMYKDYIDIAKRYGKKTFMHSDGNILAIIPHLIEIGLDALNSQIFCMGVENLAPYKGKITFWGEIDRQHILPAGTTQDVHNAVKSVYETLWQDGGCIAQCEFGPGAKPENVYQVFKSWQEMRS